MNAPTRWSWSPAPPRPLDDFHAALVLLTRLYDAACEEAGATGTERARTRVARYEQAVRLLLAESPDIRNEDWST